MNFRLLLLLSFIVFTPILFAADPSPTPAESKASEDRSPTLSIMEALQVAQQYMAAQKIDLSAHFVTGARYFDGVSKTGTSSKGPYWLVSYEPKERVQGGQYFVHVYMNREAGHVGGR